MNRFASLAAVVLCSAALADERAPVKVPALPKAPAIDGQLKDLARGVALDTHAAAGVLDGKVAVVKSTLYLGVTVTDAELAPGSQLTVSLHFPGAGATAHGYTFRFGPDGKRAPTDPLTPAFASEGVRAAVKATSTGMTLEAAIPATSLPRFPATEPLALEVCLGYEPPAGSEAKPASSCANGEPGKSLLLPEELRRGLKLKPPETVNALEGRPNGWLGFGVLHFPRWAKANAPFHLESLRDFVTDDQSIDPSAVGLGVPPELSLPDGREVYSVVTGKNPYAAEGKCNAENELRMALYLVKDDQAERALEWPVATCAFGRATSMSVDEEGTLTIGYSNGATVTFTWTKDHFDRTEIGSR